MPNSPNRSTTGAWPSPTAEQWRALRDAHGLTQTQAGELVLTPLSTVQKWEKGTNRIPPMAWDLFRIRLGVMPASTSR
ncbi:helix-turn-helix domain-containing protein [Orrella dioscoreae]|uniref:helix-turn-helix domain-containing protein n=1 Tax=Orrella dioscoreae TaxID=1851544 RepID=UPI0038CD9BBF